MAGFMFPNVVYRATVYRTGDRPTLLALTLRSRRSPCYRVSKVKVPKGMKSLPKLWVNIILLIRFTLIPQADSLFQIFPVEGNKIIAKQILVVHTIFQFNNAQTRLAN